MILIWQKWYIKFSIIQEAICHISLQELRILAQAVCNKLQIFTPPPELKNLNSLERILVSQRILF